MKRFLCMTAILCCVVPGVEVRADSSFQPSIAPGAWAIQFGLDSDFRLGRFNEATVSLKRHFSEYGALRMSADISGSLTDNEVTNSIGNSSESDSDGFSFAGTVQYLRYFRGEGRVYPYAGVGPRFVVNRSSSDASSNVGTITNRHTRIYAGVALSMGAELFLRETISLHGEYTGAVVYRYDKRESESVTTDSGRMRSEDKTDGVESIDGRVALGLSLYF